MVGTIKSHKREILDAIDRLHRLVEQTFTDDEDDVNNIDEE